MRCVKDGGGLGWEGSSKCYTVGEERGCRPKREDGTIPDFWKDTCRLGVGHEPPSAKTEFLEKRGRKENERPCNEPF